jgi:hypothetical protein
MHDEILKELERVLGSREAILANSHTRVCNKADEKLSPN